MILRCSKVPIDIFIFVMYMRLLHFFVSFKLAKYRKNLVSFTCCNRFTVVIVFFLGVLAFYSTFMRAAYNVCKYILEDNSPQENELIMVYEIENAIVWPIIDWLMGSAILYLFYTIGMQKLRSERAGEVKEGFDHFKT